MRLSPARRADAGFTLVELLVTIVILAIVTVPLAGAVIGWLRNADATTDRLALSHDAQISAAYFAQDVAAVGTRDYTVPGSTPFKQSIQLNAAYDAGGYPCHKPDGTPAPVAKVRFLADSWTPGSSPTVKTDVVAYYLTPPVNNVSELHRIRCSGSAVAPNDATLAHYVYNGPVPTDPNDKRRPPALTCSSTCDAAAVPDRVTLVFWSTKASADPYEITLNGQRRQT